jgi:thioesterase domain-containing protein
MTNKLILFDSFTPEVHELFVEDNDEQNIDPFFQQSTNRNNALRIEENLPKFKGQAYLIKAIAYETNLSKTNKDIMSQQKYNGWDKYCDNINVVHVNLSHPELFEEENIKILSKDIRNMF